MTTLRQYTGQVTIGGSVVETVNDICIGSDGVFSLCSGKAAYSNIIEDAIRTLVGELQLDMGQGVDYENTVWAGRKRIERWKTSVRKRVMAFGFVKSIESFTASLDGNQKLSFVLTISVDDGDTVTIEG